MKKMSSVEEFINFREMVLQSTKRDKPALVICAGTGGQASGANDIMRIIKREILEKNLQEKITLKITGCQGFCELDPFIIVEPGRHLYPKLKMSDVPKIVDAALNGKIIHELIYKEPGAEKTSYCKDDLAFFKKQTRTILGMNEKIDPIKTFDYIRQGGYAALIKILSQPDPDWIIQEVKKSELRGRGGAGFLTGTKWGFARVYSARASKAYVVCNADEGDPGAYMDRSILEGNPHAVMEGLIIAGIAIGATKGFIYVRNEYPLAIKHSYLAIRHLEDLGLLGENILGTGINFKIDIIRGAGAFVCGEETALIRSIEGKFSEPKQRPPYPVEKGINGFPTCINNVETLANIPIVISKGAEEYSKVGVPGNTGTKIFSLVGKIKNTGLVEVPMGMPLKEIIYDIGGGSNDKSKIKAVQTGGPSGGCIPTELFDLPIDYDSLKKVGSIMGSGGMIVMDENTCMVDIAKYYMNFLKEESCGKCFPCRKGTQRMYELLDDISKGEGTIEKISLLEELAKVVADTTMCGLGQTAPNPVLSTIKYFINEYKEHILEKKCRAFVCKDLVGASCQSACPVGTEVWKYVAHIERGEYDEAYQAIRSANPFPSICARVCNHPCETRCKLGTTGDNPVAIRTLKRFVVDNVDPSKYKPVYETEVKHDEKVAIIGAGPAGLAAAHQLSLLGYKSTVFDSGKQPGGMLLSGIPEYRLPRDILSKEIDSLVDDNVEIKCNSKFGADLTVKSLFKDGYKAVFLAMGAHKSKKISIDGEDKQGIYSSMEFLKSYNLHGKNLAAGKVGVIGGGNSAMDAARVALRQENVESVTILYRRTKNEMPAIEEEIEAAVEEGIKFVTLVSPSSIESTDDKLTGIKLIKNELGEIDNSGRRRPLPVKDSEYVEPLDTLIVAISEEPENGSLLDSQVELTKWGTVAASDVTFETNVKGIFAGGDLVTGPNTVIDAIAMGKKAARFISKYIKGEDLSPVYTKVLPEQYIEPSNIESTDELNKDRVSVPTALMEQRIKSMLEVENTIDEKLAINEARRCLRCDLEFTESKAKA